MRKKKQSTLLSSEKFVFLFFLVLLGTNLYRGFGLRTMGSEFYGGSYVIYNMVGLLFYLLSGGIELSEKQVKVFFFGALLTTALPFLAQLALVYIGPAAAPLLTFIRADYRTIFGEVMGTADVSTARFTGASYWGYSLLCLGLVYKFRHRWETFLVLALAVFLVALSGFRSRLFYVFVMMALWSVYYSRRRMQTIFWWAVAGVLVWFVTFLFIDQFPFGMQRALSAIPFLPKSSEMTQDTSLDWRVQVWKLCQQHLQEFLLIGRGRSPDISEFAYLQESIYATPDFFYHMHGYHNGFYSLIIDYGMLGFVFAAGLMIAGCKEAWAGLVLAKDRSDLISRFYVFNVLGMIYICVIFFAIYGDVEMTLMWILLYMATLRVLRNTLKARINESTPREKNDFREESAVNSWRRPRKTK
jgi:hypothetical protein